MAGRTDRWLRNLSITLIVAGLLIGFFSIGVVNALPRGSSETLGDILRLSILQIAPLLVVTGLIIFVGRKSWLVSILLVIFLLCGTVYALPLLLQIYTPIHLDCLSGARLLTWVDANGDGRVSDGEPPLPGVEYKTPSERGFSPYITTDADGKGNTIRVTSCPGGFGDSVEVLSPRGYRPTTPTKCTTPKDTRVCMFGFQSIYSPSQP